MHSLECGPDFTCKLEEMFKDIELSMDLSHTFKEVHTNSFSVYNIAIYNTVLYLAKPKENMSGHECKCIIQSKLAFLPRSESEYANRGKIRIMMMH